MPAANLKASSPPTPSTYWRVPRLWEGCTAFVIGGGPSIVELGHDKLIEKLEGRHPVIAINNGFELAPWADVLYWADNYWLCDQNWKRLHHHVGWLKVSRQNPTLIDIKRDQIPRWLREVKVIRCTMQPFLSDASDSVGGKNGGHNSIDMAHLFGAKRIALIGFDMHERQKRSNWHNKHSRPPRTDSFRNWIEDLGRLQMSARSRGIEIINCNPSSAIRCFGFAELGDLI